MGEALVVLGAGDHSLTVVTTALSIGLDVLACFDDDEDVCGGEILGVAIVGPIADAPTDVPAIMAIGSNAARRSRVDETTFTYTTVVHPSVLVGHDVAIAEGAVVLAGAIVQAGSGVGPHSIIAIGAVLSHDSHIGSFTHIGPGAALAGRVTVQDGAFVGTGASIIPGITIGFDAVVGAGAVVIRDVPPGATVVGNPARTLER